MYASLLPTRTGHGATLPDCIAEGVRFPDHPIGVLAADSECYPLFWALFEPIIARLHPLYSADPSWTHPQDLNLGNLRLEEIQTGAARILSVRLSVARNLLGYPMPPIMAKNHRLEVRAIVFDALRQLEHGVVGATLMLEDMEEVTLLSDELGSLGLTPVSGNATPLWGKTRWQGESRREARDNGVLNTPNPRTAAGHQSRERLSGRGVFVSKSEARSLCVWANAGGDHLRVTCTEDIRHHYCRHRQGERGEGGVVGEAPISSAVSAVLTSLGEVLEGLADQGGLRFDWSPQLGYVTCSPSELGTAMTASFLVVLQRAPWCPGFDRVCMALGVVVEPAGEGNQIGQGWAAGSAGGGRGGRAGTGAGARSGGGDETNTSKGGGKSGSDESLSKAEEEEQEGGEWDGVFVVSNRWTLGVSEVETIQNLLEGVARLLEVDNKATEVLDAVEMAAEEGWEADAMAAEAEEAAAGLVAQAERERTSGSEPDEANCRGILAGGARSRAGTCTGGGGIEASGGVAPRHGAEVNGREGDTDQGWWEEVFQSFGAALQWL